MKQLIEEFIRQNDIVREFLNTAGDDYTNADNGVPIFSEFLLLTKFNSALGVSFANMLQMTNNNILIDQYELEDISYLFDSLLKVQNYDLDTFVEAAHFQWSVMDDKDKAISIVKEGIAKAKQKIDELERVLDSIKSD